MTARSNMELAEAVADQHTEFYRTNPRGQLAQACFVEHADGHSAILPCSWASAEERQAIIALLRVYMEMHHATRYAFWSEAWMVAPLPDEEVRDYQHGELAKHPDRQEVVFTFVVDRDGQRVGVAQRIVRGRHGGVRKLERADMDGMDGIGGAMAELFPPRSLQ
jgi:hypothetical protein